MGIVFTTADRDWELEPGLGTLLTVSDKPLHASPKLGSGAQTFYGASRRQHVEIAIAAAGNVREM